MGQRHSYYTDPQGTAGGVSEEEGREAGKEGKKLCLLCFPNGDVWPSCGRAGGELVLEAAGTDYWPVIKPIGSISPRPAPHTTDTGPILNMFYTSEYFSPITMYLITERI